MSHYTSRLIGSVLIPLLLAAITPTLRADAGESLYKGKCAACHGADGSGNTPAGKSLKLRDFHSEDVQKQSDAELTAIITDGKGKMPPYGKKLTADEIKSLVAFLRTLKK